MVTLSSVETVTEGIMYIYRADTFCDDCGERIKRSLNCPGNPDDETTFDSDDYPKYAPNNEPVDYPDHCARDRYCMNRIDLRNSAQVYGSDRYIGALLSNRLTEEGKQYLRDMLNTIPRGNYQRALHAYWRAAFHYRERNYGCG